MKRFQRVIFFAHANELNRLAGDAADAECRAATRVAIELGQYHAGERELLVKFLRRAHRILPGHSISHEEDFRGREQLLK